MKFKTLLPYAGLFILAITAGMYASYLTFKPRHPLRPQTEALLLHGAKPLPEFTLTQTDGTAFTRDTLKDHWSLLYFGYTHCPDACPTTLAALNQVMAKLAKSPAALRPAVYFISVDPKRDEPKLLKDYVLYFNPGFVGVTGSLDALRTLTGPLGVEFSYGSADKKGDYGVNHSAFVILVDKQAEQVALFMPPLDATRMSTDYLNILGYYGEIE